MRIVLLASLANRSLDDVTDQHRRGDRADAAGHRRDRLDDWLDFVELGVARDGTLAALAVDLLRIPVDRNVDDDLSRADEVLRQGTQNTRGRNEDVRAARDLGRC